MQIDRDRKDPAEVAKEYMKKLDIAEPKAIADAPIDEKAELPKEQDSSPEKKDAENVEPKINKDKQDVEPELNEEEVKLVETPDEKLDEIKKTQKQEAIKKRNLGAEKRINELIAKQKSLEELVKNRDVEYRTKLAELEGEKKALEAKINPVTTNTPQDKEKERIQKYIEEDRSKPREQRREMAKSELEEWLIEDYAEATRWMVKQERRREVELERDSLEMNNTAKAHEILRQQDISKMRVEARHPELSKIDTRKAELAEQGMDQKAIHETLCKENPKYKVISEILADKDFVSKSIISPDFPELIEKEMLARIDKPKAKVDLQARIDELEDQLRALTLKREPVGVSVGSRQKVGANMTTRPDNPDVDKTLSLLKKKGFNMNKEDYDKMVTRRKEIRGAEEFDES